MTTYRLICRIIQLLCLAAAVAPLFLMSFRQITDDYGEATFYAVKTVTWIALAIYWQREGAA